MKSSWPCTTSICCFLRSFCCRRSGIGDVRVEIGTEAQDGVTRALFLSHVKVVLQTVNSRVFLGAVVGHVGEGAGVLRGLPTHVIEADDTKGD